MISFAIKTKNLSFLVSNTSPAHYVHVQLGVYLKNINKEEENLIKPVMSLKSDRVFDAS